MAFDALSVESWRALLRKPPPIPPLPEPTVTDVMQLLGVALGAEVRFYGMPIVSLAPGSSIEVADRCVLCSLPEHTALGVSHPVILRTLRSGARIRVGADSGISGGVLCAAVGIDIGASCLIGANVTIADTDFHPLNPVNRRHSDDPRQIATGRVVIEDNVFVGTGSLILKGVTIGRNSVIGAGSVVTRDVPANAIAAGNPAQVIGSVA